jgi:hypothetical protein
MNDTSYSSGTPEPSNDLQISRRELLKTMAALGGAVAASSLLPEKWSQPQVGVGALPAHAQSSLCFPPYEIDHCTIEIIENAGVELVTSAWILPPCPGIQMIVFLYYIYTEEQTLRRSPQSVLPVILTDSNGKATWATSIIEFPQGATEVYAEWNFFNSADGTDSCKTNHLDIGVYS